MVELWEPYLAMRAFLEGDLSLIGSLISLAQREDNREGVGSDYSIQSAKITPSPESAAEVLPYIQAGFGRCLEPDYRSCKMTHRLRAYVRIHSEPGIEHSSKELGQELG